MCLGVKDTYYNFNQFPDELENLLDDSESETEMMDIEYVQAHNIIYAGHDFATDYHIPQHPDFISTTSYLLEEDDEKIALVNVHTGDENGLPHLMVTSSNRQPAALARLKEYAGEGHYRYTVLQGDPFMEKDFDDDWEDVETDDDFDEEDLEDEDEEDPDFIFWNKEEWAAFITKTNPDEYLQHGAEMTYIHLKAITIPGLKSRGMDFQEMSRKAFQGVDWDQEAEEKTWLYSEQEKDELEQLYDQLFGGERSPKELRRIVESLRKGIDRWPGNPIFRNYLYNTYLLLGDTKAADKELLESIQLFPDYLMAKTIYAGWLMKNGRSGEVPSLFNNSSYLSELYRKRQHFHLNEFMNFTSAWLLYYLQIEDFYMADFYGNLLECLPDQVLRHQQEDLLQLLMIRRAMDVMKLLDKVRNSPKEMNDLTILLATDNPNLSDLFSTPKTK